MLKILLVIFVLFGALILIGYKHLFSKIVTKALNSESTLKLPDLNDVVITYIIFCTIILFTNLIVTSAKVFEKQVGCYNNMTVESIEYEVCKNEYSTIIFKHQEETLSKILVDYKDVIDDIETTRSKVSTDRIDNIYYSLQNSQQSEREQHLYVLISIYRNYYETKFVDLDIEKEN